MNQIDLTINKVCSTCKTNTPLRYLSEVVTLSERGGLEVRIDPDEFLLCPTCGNPQRLHIQARSYELANHLDNPLTRALYERQLRVEKEGRLLPDRLGGRYEPQNPMGHGLTTMDYRGIDRQ